MWGIYELKISIYHNGDYLHNSLLFLYICIANKKQIVMNTPKFLLHQSYLNEPTYDCLYSSTLEFYTLSGLLSFYRYLLNHGFVYEYIHKRFVKSADGIFRIILVL